MRFCVPVDGKFWAADSEGVYCRACPRTRASMCMRCSPLVVCLSRSVAMLLVLLYAASPSDEVAHVSLLAISQFVWCFSSRATYLSRAFCERDMTQWCMALCDDLVRASPAPAAGLVASMSCAPGASVSIRRGGRAL